MIESPCPQLKHRCLYVWCVNVFYPICGLICRWTRKRRCAYVWGTEVHVRSSLRLCFGLIFVARPLSQTQSLQIGLVLLLDSLFSGSFVFVSWLELQTGCHACLAFAWGSGNPNCVPCTHLAGALTAEPPSWPFLLVFPSPQVNSKLNVCDRTITPGLPRVPSEFLQVHLAPCVSAFTENNTQTCDYWFLFSERRDQEYVENGMIIVLGMKCKRLEGAGVVQLYSEHVTISDVSEAPRAGVMSKTQKAAYVLIFT